MKEILAGGSFNNAVAALSLGARLTYKGRWLEVWALEDEDFQKLLTVGESDWPEFFGWWRSANGCNIEHYPTHTFTVNGKEMVGWYDEQRLDDYVDDEFTEEYYFAEAYPSLTAYLSEVIGTSTEKNVCAVAVGLARLNNLALSELFEQYQPKEEP